ncbi:hypothetical protein [Anaeromyxobacter terrae]|uniref:hypothetical protein n=1 Tax=Anaeromyxobacter terrae TaxID=2925406 RepID=UPI001F580313|nr:hypothetical protein [Anaeromyxobacter sp. SG22]
MRIDFWDELRGGWRYEVPARRWMHNEVTIVLLVIEDAGRVRHGAPPYYVRHLGRRFYSLEEAKLAIEGKAPTARRAQ